MPSEIVLGYPPRQFRECYLSRIGFVKTRESPGGNTTDTLRPVSELPVLTSPPLKDRSNALPDSFLSQLTT